MYDPKGGDKPAYDPPAGTKPYNEPPVKEPPYPPGQQPPPVEPPTDYPTDQTTEPEEPPKPPCEDPHSTCDCKDWDIPNCPTVDVPFRRLIAKLEALLEEFAQKPTDATKKFAEDLKDAEKEYQGIVALVTKFKEFYDKLDCRLAEVRAAKESIDSSLGDKPSKPEREGIKKAREQDYDAKEKEFCCAWIKCRDHYIDMLDCLEQAKTEEEEAKSNYEAIKGFEKTLSDRFTELLGLKDQAIKLSGELRFKAAFAASLEFDDVVSELSIVRDWWYARADCNGGDEKDPCAPKEESKGDVKEDWKPEKFRARLICRLRELLLAKYQRFRWQHDFLSRQSENVRMKEACEKFRKERRDQFIQEADDIPETSGGGGAGQYGEQPQPGGEYPGGEKPGYPQTPTGQYPTGQTPEYPQQQPPGTGQYPGGQTPGGQTPQYQQSPTQQYPTGQKPEYPDTQQPPTDKYQGRPKK